MDFSKFSDADFDAKQWVNSALRAHKDARIPIDVSPDIAEVDAKYWYIPSGTCFYTRDEASAVHSGWSSFDFSMRWL